MDIHPPGSAIRQKYESFPRPCRVALHLVFTGMGASSGFGCVRKAEFGQIDAFSFHAEKYAQKPAAPPRTAPATAPTARPVTPNFQNPAAPIATAPISAPPIPHLMVVAVSRSKSLPTSLRIFPVSDFSRVSGAEPLSGWCSGFIEVDCSKLICESLERYSDSSCRLSHASAADGS